MEKGKIKTLNDYYRKYRQDIKIGDVLKGADKDEIITMLLERVFSMDQMLNDIAIAEKRKKDTSP